ncbi:MAG: hypothetical protein ACM3PX_09750 [Omnitrophica WOR_2 bacterium]|jgi:hypothetical protein
MKKALLLLMMALLFSILCLTTKAQQQVDTLNLYQVETTDGNQFTGVLMADDQEQITLKTEKLGTIIIKKADIIKMTKLEAKNVVDGKVWLENTQSSRYFWAPNGFGLKKGEGYYQNLWIMMNQISLGLTDNFSIGVGLIPLFLFGADAAQYSPIWIVPKFSIPITKDQFSIGAGILAGNAGFQPNSGFGIAYGVATLGNRNDNFTFGLGYGYAGSDWAKRPVITLGFMARTGPKGYILSENYYIKTEDVSLVLFSIGGRTLSSHIGIDYGLFIPIEKDMDFIALPWLGLSVPFKNKKK